MEYAGFLIRRERLARSWSQEGLCRGVCAVSYLSKIEQGKATPSPQIVTVLLARMGVPWHGDPQKTEDACALAQQFYEALFSCEQAALKALWEQIAPSWEQWANGPCAPDFMLLRAMAQPEHHRPLEQALEPCLSERALAVQRVLQSRETEAVRLYPCGWTYLMAGGSAYEKGNTSAPELLQSGYQLAAQEGRPRVMLQCRLFLGNCCSNRWDVNAMQAHYRVAHRLARALDDRASLRAIAYNTASTRLETGDYAGALAYFSALETPDCMDLHKLAICYEKLGRPAEALDALQRAGQAAPSAPVEPQLAALMCRVVRCRLENPAYLDDENYGALLLECFAACRAQLPAGYAGFHLPWVLEWYTANRQYKQAFELLLNFPGFPANLA